jgi:hypothetical protein
MSNKSMYTGRDTDRAACTNMIQDPLLEYAIKEYESLKAASGNAQRCLGIPSSQSSQPTADQDWYNIWRIGQRVHYGFATTLDKIPTSATMTSPKVESAFAPDDQAIRFDWEVQTSVNGRRRTLRSGTGPIKLQGMWSPPVEVQRARTTSSQASGATSKEHSADEDSEGGK